MNCKYGGCHRYSKRPLPILDAGLFGPLHPQSIQFIDDPGDLLNFYFIVPGFLPSLTSACGSRLVLLSSSHTASTCPPKAALSMPHHFVAWTIAMLLACIRRLAPQCPLQTCYCWFLLFSWWFCLLFPEVQITIRGWYLRSYMHLSGSCAGFPGIFC